MHLQRIVIEADDATFRLDLHPGLTVVAGAGPLERDGLSGEILTALGPGRPGVHLELTTDAGERLALFRPSGARHRMVDVDRALDVTPRWTDAAGHLDPLGRAGLSLSAARRLLRTTGADLRTSTRYEEVIDRLAQIDQTRLWEVARTVTEREGELAELVEASGGTLADADLIQEIERRHAEFEATDAATERVRSASFSVAATAGLLVLPIAAVASPLLAVPVALVALGATGASGWWWHVLEQARRREAAALEAAGVESYLAFTLRRANAMVADDHQRRLLLTAREAHRAAQTQWRLLAGEVPVGWALDHRDPIRRRATELRREAGVRSPMAAHLTADQWAAATLGPALDARLEAARGAGPGGEDLPMVLDDVLADVHGDAKLALLGRLVAASTRQQVVYLTENDEELLAWARLEQVGGQVRVVEPQGRDDGDRTGRHRHVAA